MRENDVSTYFQYEISTYLTSMFKNAVMRDANKSKLREYFTKDVKQCKLTTNTAHVADGRALLRIVKWLPNQTYDEIIAQYREYLIAIFGTCCVVFDGYDRVQKIININLMGSNVSMVTVLQNVEVPQKAFLKNSFSIFEALGNADTIIVKVAIQLAKEGSSVVVHADDVDVFCMPMHHYKGNVYDIYFNTMKKVDETRKY